VKVAVISLVQRLVRHNVCWVLVGGDLLTPPPLFLYILYSLFLILNEIRHNPPKLIKKKNNIWRKEQLSQENAPTNQIRFFGVYKKVNSCVNKTII